MILPYLPLLTICYLAQPYLFFYFGWLKLPIAIIATFILFFSLKKVFKNISITEKYNLINKKWILVLLILFIWTFLSGSGGIGGYQNSDYVKHNAVLKDLTTYSWPVQYESLNNNYLVYYTAYYLPAAAIGKLLPEVQGVILLLFTFIGVVLSFAWLQRLTNKNILFATILFIFFSGLDSVGYVLYKHHHPYLYEHIDNWHTLWQFSSNTTLLFWVPQHFIPACLITFLILDAFVKKLSPVNIIFYVALSLLWSPFVAIGLLPFIVFYFFANRSLKWLSFQNSIFSIMQVIVVGSYLLSGNINQSNGGFTFLLFKQPYFIFHLMVFLSLEIGGILFFIFLQNITVHKKGLSFQIRSLSKEYMQLTIVSVLTLTIILFFKLGINNDLVMRGSIPALLILQILLIKHFSFKTSPLYLFLAVMFFVGIFITPLNEISRAYRMYGINEQQLSVAQLEPKELRNLYVGSSKSFFFQVFGR